MRLALSQRRILLGRKRGRPYPVGIQHSGTKSLKDSCDRGLLGLPGRIAIWFSIALLPVCPTRIWAQAGSLDLSFDVPLNYLARVSAIAAQTNGRVLIGGSFSLGGGKPSNLARLNADGSLDTNFNIGSGPSSNVAAI